MSNDRAVFGPAGMCAKASESGVKSTEKLLEYLSARDVDLFEYQCGRGVNIGEEKARLLCKKAKEQNIILTLHAPYYISLASPEEQKRDNSVNYILQSARAADWLGAKRIVVHPGGIGKYTREQAYDIAIETLGRAVKALEEEHLDHIIVCPEVMGKINQLGSLSEVLGFCRRYENMLPCVDFGHLNSRLQGKLDYAQAINEIFMAIGAERARKIHIHFSKIEYTAGGEKQHLTFEDEKFGPDYRPLMEQFAKRGMKPYVVCESAGTQTDDALTMKEYYSSLFDRKNEYVDENGMIECDECESKYLYGTSKMAKLCPHCAHVLYGYPDCKHEFENGRCKHCLWDGTKSEYIKWLEE